MCSDTLPGALAWRKLQSHYADRRVTYRHPPMRQVHSPVRPRALSRCVVRCNDLWGQCYSLHASVCVLYNTKMLSALLCGVGVGRRVLGAGCGDKKWGWLLGNCTQDTLSLRELCERGCGRLSLQTVKGELPQQLCLNDM